VNRRPRPSERRSSLEGAHVLLLVENLSVPADPRVWPEALALREAGMEVTVVCPRGTTRDRDRHEVREGVEIHRYPLRPASGALGYVAEYAGAAARTAWLTGKLAARKPIDVVHASNPPDILLLAVSYLKLQGTRFLFDQHDLAPELYEARFGRGHDPLYWLLRGFERTAFALADVVVSPNESYRRLAISRGGKAPDDVVVVRNAPDESRLYRVPPDPALARGKPHLISYLGAMAPQDGVEHAFRALAHLRQTRDDWRAIFMGDGPSLPSLRDLAQRLDLGDLVEFAGWVEGDYVRSVLSSSSVCVAPEPSSPLNDVSTLIKIAEYMAVGAPVACYDLTESRATAGDAALYAKPSDPKSLAACISTILDSPELRERLGSEGERRLHEQFSWRRSKAALLDAYRRALRVS
jgi:glycosyltransferase involved in cell wall biosynthesis